MEYVVLRVEGLEAVTDANRYALLHLPAEDAPVPSGSSRECGQVRRSQGMFPMEYRKRRSGKAGPRREPVSLPEQCAAPFRGLLHRLK